MKTFFSTFVLALLTIACQKDTRTPEQRIHDTFNNLVARTRFYSEDNEGRMLRKGVIAKKFSVEGYDGLVVEYLLALAPDSSRIWQGQSLDSLAVGDTVRVQTMSYNNCDACSESFVNEFTRWRN
jgi:hypothetical protein